VKSDRTATFANPDPVQRTVQSIQCIDQGFGLGYPILSPQALSHFVQGLN
jgi:hypothetical protein